MTTIKRKVRDPSKEYLIWGVACLWPLVLLAMYGASAPRVGQPEQPGHMRFKMRELLDRVDVLGYGPTHPRVAVVISGDNKEDLVSSLESVFRMTDLARIFGVCVVVDGLSEDAKLVRDLNKIESGLIPHWHGDHPDLHEAGKESDEDAHGKLVHVVFNKERMGVAASRSDGAHFLKFLADAHEEAGLKAPEEDLILLIMSAGTQLTSRKWLGPVTDSLIVPPPMLGQDNPMVSMKLANAVSFNLEGPGQRTTFDSTLTPVVAEANAEELNESSGASYTTPAWSGGAIAMRMETYLDLPQQDWSLIHPWEADLDLSMNLWLCGDGIDILKDVEVTRMSNPRPEPLPVESAARFAASWLDPSMSKKLYHAYTQTYLELTFLEWETFEAIARQEPTFTKDLASKCRSFDWFVETVAPELAEIQQMSDEIKAAEEEKEEERKERAAKKEEAKKNEPDPVEVQRKVEEKKPEPKKEDEDSVEIPPRPDDKPDEDSVEIPPRPDNKAVPKKPLCPECLEIVQRAKPVDISFVDVSDGHKEHPHMGARDENGKYGYIYDETELRRNPPKMSFEGDALTKACTKRDNNYRMLHEKVRVDFAGHEAAEKTGHRDKIFCLVYTIEEGHVNVPRIRETWG